MVKPYNNTNSKKSEVRAMFNSIARNYDFLNRLLSFRIDVIWRKRLIRKLKEYHPSSIIDLATGTGDLAIMASKIKPESITGVDLSIGMIKVGRTKIQAKGLSAMISLHEGDAENLEFPDNTFDAATVAFGVRNYENLEAGLKETLRVLKLGAPFLILEFSYPKNAVVKMGYNFYSKFLLPSIGKLISKDAAAYSYLPESIKAFPHGEAFLEILQSCGFAKCTFTILSSGIATLYIGHKH